MTVKPVMEPGPYVLHVVDRADADEIMEKGAEYGLRALHIGLTALRTAAGALDAETIRRQGEQLLKDVQAIVNGQDQAIHLSLCEYFDPRTGKLPERLDVLLKTHGGELLQYLSKEVDKAILPLIQALDPKYQGNFVELLKKALDARNQEIIKQFSLDDNQSVISRFLRENKTSNAEFMTGLGDKVKQVIDSLSLDDPSSGLSRMREEIRDGLKEMATIQKGIELAVASLQTAKTEQARSTTHGLVFEESVCEYLIKQVPQAIRCGNVPGSIRNCKVGDAVFTLPDDFEAAGARVVIEAKQSSAYNIEKILEECDTAKANRGAQVALFVWSAKSANSSFPCLNRFGTSIVIVWDAEDPTGFCNQVFNAGIALAIALCTRMAKTTASASKSIIKLDKALEVVDKAVKRLEDIKTYAITARNASDKIVSEVERGYGALADAAEEAKEAALELRA